MFTPFLAHPDPAIHVAECLKGRNLRSSVSYCIGNLRPRLNLLRTSYTNKPFPLISVALESTPTLGIVCSSGDLPNAAQMGNTTVGPAGIGTNQSAQVLNPDATRRSQLAN